MRIHRPRPPEVPSPPATFVVGDHTLVVTKRMERRWTVTVDAHAIDSSFDTQAEAWEAGVREAHRVDELGRT